MEKVYGLHAVRVLLTRHAERVITVTVAYTDGQGTSRSLQLSTVITDYTP